MGRSHSASSSLVDHRVTWRGIWAGVMWRARVRWSMTQQVWRGGLHGGEHEWVMRCGKLALGAQWCRELSELVVGEVGKGLGLPSRYILNAPSPKVLASESQSSQCFQWLIASLSAHIYVILYVYVLNSLMFEKACYESCNSDEECGNACPVCLYGSVSYKFCKSTGITNC